MAGAGTAYAQCLYTAGAGTSTCSESGATDKLSVTNTTATGAVYGLQGSSASSGGAGVWGINTSSGSAVYGTSTTGDGVYGVSTSSTGVNGVEGHSNSTGASGVYGVNDSTGGYGVAGRSAGTAVYGEATADNGTALYGTADSTGTTNNQNVGVFGAASGDKGIGVEGQATTLNNGTGTGVYGYSTAGVGYGVYGIGALAGGSHTQATVGVYGTVNTPKGYGVQGVATTTDTGAASAGVYGVGTTAVFGGVPQVPAVRVGIGHEYFSGGNPAYNLAFKNTLTPTNFVKAWAYITTSATGVVTVHDGFNVSGVTVSSPGGGTPQITFTFAQAFTNKYYAWSAGADWPAFSCMVFNGAPNFGGRLTTSLTLSCFDTTNGNIDFTNSVQGLSLMVTGSQT